MRFDELSPSGHASDDRPEVSPLAGDALDCLLTDSLDEARGVQVRRFFDESAARRRLLARLRVWVRRDEAGWSVGEYERGWARVRAAVVVPGRDVSAHPVLKGRRFSGTQPPRRGVWSTLAGVALGMIIMTVGWYAATTGLGAHRRTSVSAYVTGNGQRANITLPDGNTVALNVASRLDVPTDYGTGDHTVHLTGEALFTVTHHAGSPFTVVAGAMTAHVLGTSFTVRHYATDTSALVAVRDGKVGVGVAAVTAGRAAEVGRHGVMRLSLADPAEFSFATGTLVLHRRRLSDAIPELDRWYNADIRVNSEALKDQVVNGTLTTGSLSDLKSILELSCNAHVMRNGRVLTLSAR